MATSTTARNPDKTRRATVRVAGRMLVVLLVTGLAPTLLANPSEGPLDLFLALDPGQPPYRGTRHLEAENGKRRGWLDIVTEYAPDTGFRYRITAEGGSDYIRTKVLKAVLDGERVVVATGEDARSSIARTNYNFQAKGIGDDGLAHVQLVPRRKERALVAGLMLLRPDQGELVRVEGRLAKNPSFWVRNVDIIRTYERIGGVVLPVAMNSTAHIRLFGAATFQMTYTYAVINGQPVE